MKIELSDHSVLDVAVSKKDMKNMRLRVCRDGSVCVSAPYGISDTRIHDFIYSKRGWIESHIKNFVKDEQGDRILFMGNEYAMEIVKDRRTGVAINQGNMTIFCGDPGKYKDVLEKWWVQQAIMHLQEMVDKWYPFVGQPDEEKPTIKVRKMKTLWGSCTSSQRTIRFNYYLMCASEEAIEYVVLHELAHLIYPNHGAEFKAFLTKYMQDWKERKKRLEQECAAIPMT